MTEVQAHGNAFEDDVIRSITGISKKEYEKLLVGGYTTPMDIVKGVLSDFNASVKVTSGDGIGCGDILRFINECSTNDFKLIIGLWDQLDKETKVFNKVFEFYITPDYFSTICGGLTIEAVKPFVTYVKDIPPGKTAQLENRYLWKEKRQSIYETYGNGLLSIDAKIDSKAQRRVQCGLKISNLIEAGIPYTKYEKDYRGISLPYEKASKPRTFKIKAA